MSGKAVFFDRDDTLIHDSHYMYKKEQLNFIDGVFDVLKKIQNAGYQLFIFSNQSGIGRGYFTEAQMHEFHSHMEKGFQEHGISFTEIIYCPHDPTQTDCDCRKPEPKLLIEACEKYKLDPKQCFMVGDRITDAQAGERAGMTSITLNCDYKNNISKLEDIFKFIPLKD